MKLKTLLCGAILPITLGIVHAQPAGQPPDLSGVWGIDRGGPGADPKFRPPAPSPLVLKPEYDKPYQERRAREAAAAQRGEQLDSTGVHCIPYGVPSMMSIGNADLRISPVTHLARHHEGEYSRDVGLVSQRQ